MGPRVLLSAYQCSPQGGSVSHIGWQWYSRLAKRVPVTLVTHIRNRTALLEAGIPLYDSEVIFIDTERFTGHLYRFVCWLFPHTEYPVSLFTSVDFYFYDWIAVSQLKKRQQLGETWDIVHQVTPVSPKSATRLHTLHHPTILGPWNGGLTLSWAFPKVILQDLNWLYPIRYLGHLVDLVLRSTHCAALILTATQATLNNIPTRYHPRCKFFLENGVDLTTFTPAPWPLPPSDTEPLRIVFVGRLVAFKGLPMLLEAIAQYPQPIQLTVVGEGPLKQSWQALTEQLGITALVTWCGNANAREVVEHLHAVHVLCLPSVRESGGAVLLEAMACARPIIAIRYGGPAELIDNEVGHLIASNGSKAVITALVNCFYDIVAHPEQWRQRGEKGRQRAEKLYGWEERIVEMLKIYQHLLQEPHEKKSHRLPN